MDTKTRNASTEAEALFGDLDKPSLHALSYALRHPDTWPEGFIWNFESCHQCAMGLAHALWQQMVPAVDRNTGASVMARTFAIPYTAAQHIFFARDGQHGADWLPMKTIVEGGFFTRRTIRKGDADAVTPEMVADQIDAFLASQ